jgi:hypothetical protein
LSKTPLPEISAEVFSAPDPTIKTGYNRASSMLE